ncbi:50S ribosomal protein L1 [Phytophthora cinnamomi]|uniref:50S ribosomal protein L1 n=1 Tax=Phytophthora cinnamomi TaxID=4785 RepID=UPI00355A1218|nr:50S ribosomal protein L1 [Phytophthora cinnamomi]
MKGSFHSQVLSSAVFDMLNASRDITSDPDTDLVQVHREDDEDVAWQVMKLGVTSDAQVTLRSENILASEDCSPVRPLECGDSVDIRGLCLTKRVKLPGGYAVLVEATTSDHRFKVNF